MFYNKEGLFRVKPVYNGKVNGYWMCDLGRDVYKFVNKAARLLDARFPLKGAKAEWVMPTVAAKKVGETLRSTGDKKSVALVVTGQHTVEEYEALITFFKNDIGTDKVYHWINNPEKLEEFDGLLLRGDKNPNTKGLGEVLAKHGIKTNWKELTEGLSSKAITTVVVAGPENQALFTDMSAKVAELSKAAKLVWLTAGKNEALETLAGDVTLIPLKSYVEKGGTFVNYAGIRQTVAKGVTIVENALSLVEVADLFAGREAREEVVHDHIGKGRVHNEFTLARGSL